MALTGLGGSPPARGHLRGSRWPQLLFRLFVCYRSLMSDDEIPVFNHADRAVFLYELAKNGGDVVSALAVVKVSVIAAFRAYKSDSEFRSAWDEALEASNLVLESAAVQRGVQGTSKTTYDKDGNVTSESTVHSDKLLEMSLKARKPDMYKDRVVTEHTGDVSVRHDIIDRIINAVKPKV